MTLSPSPLAVSVGEHRALICEGLIAVINREPDMTVVHAAPTAAGLLAADVRPDVVVIGHDPPHLDAIEVATELRDRTATIILLDRSQGADSVSRAVHTGARGILYADGNPHILPYAIRTVVRDSMAISMQAMKLLAEQLLPAPKPPTRQDLWLMLSRREAEVLQQIAHGRGNREIAQRLSITVATVKSHIYSACRKLGVQGRTHAAIMAYQAGMVRSLDEGEPPPRADRRPYARRR